MHVSLHPVMRDWCRDALGEFTEVKKFVMERVVKYCLAFQADMAEQDDVASLLDADGRYSFRVDWTNVVVELAMADGVLVLRRIVPPLDAAEALPFQD